MTRAWSVLASVVVVAAVGVGCVPAFDHDAMRTEFSNAQLCPADRLTFVDQPALSLDAWACADPAAWLHLTSSNLSGKSLTARVELLAATCQRRPSRAIAEDPERLAIWRATQLDDLRAFHLMFSTPVEVRGCGQRRFYSWEHATCRHCGGNLRDLGSAPPPASLP